MFAQRWLIASIGVTAMVFSASASAGAPPATLRLTPPVAEMGMFFNGIRVSFEATVPEGQQVAALCTGKDSPLKLKRKGKVGGILWMNVGEVELDRVPLLYMLSTSRPLKELAPPAVLTKIRLGQRAVAATAGDAPADVLSEVIKLKESEGLFSFAEGGAKHEAAGKGTARFTGSFTLPAHVPPGEYTVRLFGFKGQQPTLLASKKLRMVRVGTASMITSLARNHGLLYGLFAVIVALGVGILTGFVFRKGMQKAH